MANVFDDKEKGKNDLLYGGDARSALQQAMLASGRNPFTTNPFTAQLMRAAPGLQLAMRQQGLGSGMSPTDLADRGGESAMLGQFMQDALKGGNVYSTLNSAAKGVPGMLNQITGIQGDIANGRMTADQANPFAELLQGSFDDPEGVQGAMTSLLGPLLGNQLGQAYSRQVGNIGTANQRAFADSGNPNANFWEYMFQNMTPGQAVGGGSGSQASAQANAVPNPAGAPTAGEPGGPPLANGPVLGDPTPNMFKGQGATALESAPPGMQRNQSGAAVPMGPDVPIGPDLPPEQVAAVAAQAGISEDSLLKILRDIAMGASTQAGRGVQPQWMKNFYQGGVNTVQNNPYIQRLLAQLGG